MPGSTGYPDLRSLSGIREHTATDRRTQVQTKWIRSSGQTSTPNQTQQGNVKKFGETAGATEARFKGECYVLLPDVSTDINKSTKNEKSLYSRLAR